MVIPAERMKTRAQHVVPLSDRVLALLEQQKQYSTSQQYVFTSRVPGQPLDEKAIRAILRYMDERCTPHGFRSTFRTWCAEETSFDFYATEMCLSHAVGSAVAQAYLRGDGISKRRHSRSWRKTGIPKLVRFTPMSGGKADIADWPVRANS